MFPSQGLFKKLLCPHYPKCNRLQCFYSHDAKLHTPAPATSSSKSTQPTQSTSTGIKRKLTSTPAQESTSSSDPTPAAKRKVVSTTKTTAAATSTITTSKDTMTRPAPPATTSTASQIPKSNSNTVPVKRPASSPALAPAPPIAQRRTAVATTVPACGPPRILPDIRAHAALKTRQTCANKIYEQFCRIYELLMAQHPSLATEHAQRQEDDIHSKTTNEAGYKQMTMNVLMRLKKRPVARDINDTGIDGEWMDPEAKAAAAATPMEKLQPLILSDMQREQMNYPPLNLLEMEKKENVQTVGSKRTCERCKKEYIVNDMLSEANQKACTYHYGRMRQTMSFGEKQRVYMCCNDSHGSAGCVRGPHVYKDTDFAEMHAKIPFVKVPDTPPSERKNLVALDCEMAYTTAGMELIRLTAVDESGKVLVDEMCYPSYMVLDLNSRYSGIKTLAGVKNDLKSVRDMLFKYVDKDTVLLGHGLENDLQALRIIHDKVIDTAALFPHPKGLPFRFGLRVLATRYLSRFIQESASGHDSFEDAKTCVDLLHAYFKLPRNK